MLYQFEILESRLYVGKIKLSHISCCLSANAYESNSILFTNNKLILFQRRLKMSKITQNAYLNTADWHLMTCIIYSVSFRSKLDPVSLHRQLSALHKLSKVYELWTFCMARKQEWPHFFFSKYVDWY